MEEGLPEIDKNEKMHKEIDTLLERLLAVERKVDAIAQHLGVNGADLGLGDPYAKKGGEE
ncbi:MAG TPA: hypothetical protein VL197_03865 [Nitrospirota bacterium]|nr:hypothetical protein [Nitrospirota bacterium]